MKRITIKELTTYAMITAIYVLITWALSFISYNGIQFRIAEALVLLCFYNKKYFIPLTLGCLISNILSPLGPLDLAFGVAATMLSLLGVMFSKNIYVASLFPTLVNGILIGVELCIIEETFALVPFLVNFGTVALGEFVCVSIIGVIIFKLFERNEKIMELLCLNKQEE